jgi:hypothetical protein
VGVVSCVYQKAPVENWKALIYFFLFLLCSHNAAKRDGNSKTRKRHGKVLLNYEPTTPISCCLLLAARANPRHERVVATKALQPWHHVLADYSQSAWAKASRTLRRSLEPAAATKQLAADKGMLAAD